METNAKTLHFNPREWDATLSKVDSRVADQVLEFDLSKSGILLVRGGYGCGKTYLMAAIINDRWGKRAEDIKYYTETGFYDRVFKDKKLDSYSLTESIRKIFDVKYIMIDDIGRDNMTQEKIKAMETFLDKRFGDPSKKTIITTNLTNEEIINVFGWASYCRLVNEENTEIVFPSGIDFRKTKDPKQKK